LTNAYRVRKCHIINYLRVKVVLSGALAYIGIALETYIRRIDYTYITCAK